MTAPDPATVWHAVSAPGPRYGRAQGPYDADLLVIGGGFAGLSTALHAAQAGQNVLLVEAERIAWGATGRNAGFVVPNFAKVDPDAVLTQLGPDKGAQLIDFAKGSSDLVFALIREHAIDCAADASGWIQPAHSAAALAKTQMRAAAWAKLGRPAQQLNAREVADLTGAEGYLGGWIDHSGGVLNPVAYARGLARAAASAGAQIYEDTAVTQLVPHGHGWVATTPHARISARRVVLATNAYATGLVPDLAHSFFPLRVFQIATEPLPPSVRARVLPGNACVSDTRRNLFTFRFDADNRLISGGMHIFGPGAHARVPRTIHRRLARLLDLPDLPPLAYAWSGMAAVMPDYLPRLMELAPGLIAPIACNGRGIAMTTRLGQTLARWAAGVPAFSLEVPATPPTPIALHGLMRHAPNALLPLSLWRDHRDDREKRP